MPQLLETLEKNMKGEVIGGEVPLRENGFEKVDVPVVNKCNCDMNRRGSVTFNTKTEKEPNGKQNGTVFSEPPGDSNTEETGCKLCLSQCRVACIPCRANLHKPDRDSKDRKERLKYAFMCPPHGPVAKWITLGTIALLTWAVCWSILGDDVMPGGNIFGIVILFIASTIGGYLAQIIKLPPLLGMLLVGVLLGNVPHIDVGRDIKDSWSSALRKMALVIILIRAGLGLDVDALLKLKFVIIRLAFLPCLIEATAIAVSARYILDFPWVFAFMLGFVIAAVSAAVAIPFMLQFQAEGYGVEKGVPTLVMACASIDNVLAITCFSIVLGIGFAKGDLAMTIAKGPLQIIVALVLGVIAGLFLWYFPHKRSPNKAIYRFLILFGICLLAVFGSSVADWSSSGPLGVLITALVAAYKWRKQGWKGKENPLAAVFGHLWTIFQILLFGLVGALVEIRLLDWTTVALGVAVIAIGLCFRLLVAYLALLTTVFNVKERVFVLFSWLPKATVQAAIGSMVFDRAMAEKADPDIVKYGLTILMLGVVSIILTSPIGALLVAISGPKLLSKTSYDMEANVSEEEDSENDQNNEGAQTGDSGIVNAAFVSDADHNSNVGVPTVAVIGGTTDPAPSQTAESTTRL